MNRDELADALIVRMGWAEGVRDGIVAQAAAENSEALANPLDTERDWPGATDYNSAGVKSYASTEDGLGATKATLENGLYPHVLAAGVAGDAGSYVNAIANSRWGTWSNDADAQSMLASVRNSPAYGAVEVAGTGGSPPAPPPPPPPTPEPPAPPAPPQEVTVEVPVLHTEGAGPFHQPAQPVRVVQMVVGSPADGRFGPATDQAVRGFQSHHGIAADGIVGPVTWGKILNG